MQAFPPTSMYGLAFTQKAAALYGLMSSPQGSGRKRFIMIRSTKRTQLPDIAGQERLRDMLAAHNSTLDSLKLGSKAAAACRGQQSRSSQSCADSILKLLWACAVQCAMLGVTKQAVHLQLPRRASSHLQSGC